MYRLLFIDPYQSSIILSPPNQVTTYNLRIRDHTSTSSYQHLPPWFPFNKHSAYRILSIVHSSIYSSNCPSYISASLIQRSSLPSLKNHESHFLFTPILHPSKMNTWSLIYIGINYGILSHPILDP